MHFYKLTTLLTLLASPAARAAGDEIVVVASAKFPSATLSEEDIRQVYLGKTRELSGIGTVEAVDLPGTSAMHDAFSERVLNKTAKELNAYWSVRIFTGRGTPPETLHDERAVKSWVAEHVDGIGYISKKSVDSTVKVLFTVPQ